MHKFKLWILPMVLILIVGCSSVSFSTPKTLYSTMKANDKEGFEALLNAGADPNANISLTGPRGGKYTETVMRFAAELEDSDYLRLLLEHGGNPNARDNLGYPIIFDTTHTSSKYRVKNHFTVYWDNFDLLIAHGADINAVGRGDNIITYLALLYFYTDIERILNKYPNVDFNYESSFGKTLASSIQKSHPDLIILPKEKAQARDRVKTWLEQHGVEFPVANP